MRELKISDLIVVGLFIIGCLAIFAKSTYTETIPENNMVEAAAPLQQDLSKPSI